MLLTGAVTVAALALTACGGSSGGSSGGGSGSSGGSVTFAETPGAPPSYIFPMDALQYFNVSDINQFQQLMWRPLYWFANGNAVALDPTLSLAQPPKYSDQNRMVTMSLKPARWSDGTPVTARDVTFWINLLRANKANWGEYAPGYFPDDVTSVSTPNSSTVVLRLSSTVNPTWFTYNELSQITPIPQHVWDRTSASAAVSNADQSAAGAHAVYSFLDHQAKQLTTYASNHLWQVVDGPWRLKQFNPNGYAVFTANDSYFAGKPKIKTFIEEPFTSDSAEYNQLRSGGLTYGYVPTGDLGQKALLQGQGYQVVPWYEWSMNIIPLNFHNPTQGPLFSQTYIRQAMQELINQPQLESATLGGYGIIDNGPVPNGPSTQYVDSFVKSGPLPYSVSRARALLAAHGWKVAPNGVSVCARPGTGPSQCGARISAGQPLRFSLLYASGISSVNDEAQALKSSFSGAGIDVSLNQAPSSQVYATAVPCSAKQSSCSWGMAYWGNGWEFSPDNLPTGEVAFASGAIGNFGSYSDPKMDSLIKATTSQSGLAPLHTWEDYTATQVPMLFMPLAPAQISAISDKLKGATPQPADALSITPERWSLGG